MAMQIQATLIYGGMTALLVTLLGANVSRLRGTSVGIGDPLPPELVRPVRAHGNAAEWVPLGILLLLVLELSGRVGINAIHTLGGMFFLGRVLHAAGVYTKTPLSVAGAGINYLMLLIMSVWAIALRF
jgi:uncharacterized membrane protein YecN with MAPEG domain